ncbi:signal peptidase complex subunit 3B-like [Dendrobium catenatum]|uniref:signal peptidase complex subunit 3B-like n=1 Tax=Dendrobium catenatum TaxID=906689 RepID=UPI00109FF0A1|nr:signal peptidase complex subunit 3B-like [Dendrobium catenatum]
MHSFSFRTNVIVTIALTILAVICALQQLECSLPHCRSQGQLKFEHISWSAIYVHLEHKTEDLFFINRKRICDSAAIAKTRV